MRWLPGLARLSCPFTTMNLAQGRVLRQWPCPHAPSFPAMWQRRIAAVNFFHLITRERRLVKRTASPKPKKSKGNCQDLLRVWKPIFYSRKSAMMHVGGHNVIVCQSNALYRFVCSLEVQTEKVKNGDDTVWWCSRSLGRVMLPSCHGQWGMYFVKGVVQVVTCRDSCLFVCFLSFYFFCRDVWRSRSLSAAQAWRTSFMFLFWVAVVSACWVPL